MRTIPILFLICILCCRSADNNSHDTVDTAAVKRLTYNTIHEIPLPRGFKRVEVVSNSFQAWLRAIPLKKNNTIYLFNGTPKKNQSAQFAVIDINVGRRDLQQCADAVMRLRAEYLFKYKLFNQIEFIDYANKSYKWEGGMNRIDFDRFLEMVFSYCGSASLEKQLRTVTNFQDIAAGDILVKGGFPGHAMIIVDVATNNDGRKIFLLAQGYQPAQDIHVVINPINKELSPWYEVSSQEEIITPEWKFYKSQLKRW